jgi:cell division protein FtsL
VYTSHQVVISDQDILRIAAAVKLSLQEDIAKIVSIKVEKAVQPLEEKIRHLQTENSKLFLQIDELEQYGRRPIVRVTRVPENQGEDTASLILDITKKAGIELEPDEIINSHRVGNPYKRWTWPL